jgi:predicted CoA-binding protein
MPTAVVLGASLNRSKFGNKAVRAFQKAGWTVIPVNPRETEIEGIQCAMDLGAVRRHPEVLSVYLQPQIVADLASAIAALAPTEVWLNPGTSNALVVEALVRHSLTLVHDCTLVRLGMNPGDFPEGID